jgi:hypothetical protein
VRESLLLANALPTWSVAAQEDCLRWHEALLEASVQQLNRNQRSPQEYLEQLQQTQQQRLYLESIRPWLQAESFRDSLQQQRFAGLQATQSLERLLQGDELPEQQLLRRRELLQTLQGLLRQQERLRPLLPQLAALGPEEQALRAAQFQALDRQLLSALQRLVPESAQLDVEMDLQLLARQRRVPHFQPLPEPAAESADAEPRSPSPALAPLQPAAPQRPYLLQLREEDLPPALRQSRGGRPVWIPGRYMATRTLWEAAEEVKGDE